MPPLDDSVAAMISSRLRTLQIIVMAMTIGASLYLGITVFFELTPKSPDAGKESRADATPILTYIGIALAASAIVMGTVLPNAVVSAQQRRFDAQAPGSDARAPRRQSTGEMNAVPGDRLTNLYVTRIIVGVAFFEGAALLLATAHLIERRAIAVPAALAMILAIAAHFPTRDRMQTWLSRRQHAE